MSLEKHHIQAAHERIRPHIHRTPVLRCNTLDGLAGASLHFKCENFQKIGAFKIRGGMNAVLSLSPEQQGRGIATHSSGNHAQAIAYAARQVGTRAYIVMPQTSPRVKVDAVAGYG
ncbi:MAG TPA: pyridoxal-phosphate dependent enzyme, partial [Saprospiraceae bacterium]|nr:pyridoxal-phosphate dependent enzyme [Saprospiraceae bacterium]